MGDGSSATKQLALVWNRFQFFENPCHYCFANCRQKPYVLHQTDTVLFPQGVTFADGIYKTTETCLILKLLQESEVGKTSLATLPGIEPGLPP